MAFTSASAINGVTLSVSNKSAFVVSDGYIQAKRSNLPHSGKMESNQTLFSHSPTFNNNNNVLFLDILVGWVVGITVEHNAEGFVKDRFYVGSRILQPITDASGISVDMVNFIVSSLVGLLLGLFMRSFLAPQKVGPRIRALAEIVFGVAVVSFCYGMQLRVLLLQSFVAYVILLVSRRDRIATAIAVTSWSLLYLMVIHLCRLYYDYEGYTLDISGAVMLQTQRLSSLAFNLYDGARIKEAVALKSKKSVLPNGDGPVHQSQEFELEPKIMPTSRGLAVEELPDPLEFAAYSIYFHGVCIGPFVFFKDYQRYLCGYETGELPPINQRRVAYLMARVIGYGLMFAAFFTHFPVRFINDPAFQNMSLIGQFGYMSYAFYIARHKYYFGWCLAEAMGICTGNGYSGDDPTTRETLWLNVHNFDFFQIETALNLKLLIDAWNIGTVRWLREVVYFRAPPQFRTVAVFLVSAFWHGLYPGYYLMFLSFALFTHAARAWRRNIRPLLLPPTNTANKHSHLVVFVYDAATILLTHIVMEYAQAPFHLLSLVPSLVVWKQFFFLPHVLALGMILLLPVRPNQHHRQQNGS